MRETDGMRVVGAVSRMVQTGDVGVQPQAMNGRMSLRIAFALCVLVGLALAACRSTVTQPALPGGIYRSDAFHFSVTYQPGWQVNVAPASTTSRGIPLHVIITRTAVVQTTSSLVSNCSITVLNTHDTNIAPQIKLLNDRIQSKDAHLHAISLGGRPGFQEQSVRQEIPGTQLTDTHTNYYLLLNDYDYEISTDAISSDNADAALQSMVASFTIVK